jgi:hypothetical protein
MNLVHACKKEKEKLKEGRKEANKDAGASN